MASMFRVNKGSETGILATMNSFLRRNDGDMDPTEAAANHEFLTTLR